VWGGYLVFAVGALAQPLIGSVKSRQSGQPLLLFDTGVEMLGCACVFARDAAAVNAGRPEGANI
jgi:hypothetical protein